MWTYQLGGWQQREPQLGSSSRPCSQPYVACTIYRSIAPLAVITHGLESPTATPAKPPSGISGPCCQCVTSEGEAEAYKMELPHNSGARGGGGCQSNLDDQEGCRREVGLFQRWSTSPVSYLECCALVACHVGYHEGGWLLLLLLSCVCGLARATCPPWLPLPPSWRPSPAQQ